MFLRNLKKSVSQEVIQGLIVKVAFVALRLERIIYLRPETVENCLDFDSAFVDKNKELLINI